MSADLQAKYNALLLKFVGDNTIPKDPEAEMDIHKDIAQYMHEKNKRIQAQAKASYDAIVASIGLPPVPKIGMDVSHTPDESIMVVTSRIPL